MGAERRGPTVRVDVLGPLRLVVDGAPVEVRGPKRRAVLALLALAGGRAVSTDQLVDALWPSAPPESGRAALHSHVSRLRGHLGPGAARLVTVDSGYRLVLGADELDVARARALLTDARATAKRDPAAASAQLREARALWRGPVFADLSEVASLATAAVGFERLRREVTDLLIGCAIDAGQVDGVVELAADALGADPLREPAVLQLMRALAMTGQAPLALRTGRDYRQRLAAEAGLDPSAALAELERGIAGGTIDPPNAARTPTGSRARHVSRAAGPGTRLIGRGAQLAAVHRLLATERLVTVVGPGGVGKTSLALEFARRADAATVLLAPVTDPAGIPHALTAALGLREVRGNVLSACVAILGDRPTLLVIDNCEHLLEAVSELVGVVMNACPNLTVLATSRQPLGLAPECPFRLAPLPLPGPEPLRDINAGTLQRIPSVAVFLERAARVRPGFAPGPEGLCLVADIVRRLDGIPLAIELAAGRLSTFSLTDLAQRLDRALDILGTGPATSGSRHRTLRSTLEWSYQLLTSDQQRLFRHLSMFTDGVDLTAAEEVAAEMGLAADPGSALAHLVEASMIDATFEDRTRYRMLETIRAFGLDRLAAAGEDGAAAQRFLRWAVELAAWIDSAQTTEREPEADAVLRRELPNLRSAWRLARQQRLLDDAAALVLALSEVCAWRDLTEPWDWTEELASDPSQADHPHAAAVLGSAANVAYMRGDYTRAERLARAGLERATDAGGALRCLSALALADLSRGAYGDVVEHALAAAALTTRSSENLGIAALAATYAGDLDQARELNSRMVAAAVSPTLCAFGAYVDGEIANAAGRAHRADEHYARAIDLAHSSGATFVIGIASVGRLTVKANAGRVDDALRGYRDLIDYWHRSGNWTQQWVTLRNLAQLLRRLGDNQPAALLDAAAEQAPDAPATNVPADPPAAVAASTRPRVPPRPPTVSRARALETARQAIHDRLTESCGAENLVTAADQRLRG
jgi:predicted ATPase/DNA-binding SARP family transcriptional activator